MARGLLKVLPVFLAFFLFLDVVHALNIKKPVKALGGKSFLGEVVNTQPMAGTIVVRHKTMDKEFDVSMVKLKGYGSVDDIKVGERINVIYRERDGRLLAGRIEKKPDLHRFAGTVTAVLPSTSAIEVRRHSGEKERHFDASAARFKGCSSLEDIRTGERVTIQFEEQGGASVARVITKGTEGPVRKRR
jgi:hypothetical protein